MALLPHKGPPYIQAVPGRCCPSAYGHSPHPNGNKWKGRADLASKSHNTALCADRYHLCLHKSHFAEQQRETFATSEMVRATVKADTEGWGRQFKGPCPRTPEIWHRQSELGGGHRQHQHLTHCVHSGQKALTVLCGHCPEAHIQRDQAGDSTTLAVHGGNCLSLPPTFRILLVASNRNYNSNLLKPDREGGGRAEEKEGGRSGSFNCKVQNLGQIWDTNDVIMIQSCSPPYSVLISSVGSMLSQPLSFAPKYGSQELEPIFFASPGGKPCFFLQCAQGKTWTRNSLCRASYMDPELHWHQMDAERVLQWKENIDTRREGGF